MRAMMLCLFVAWPAALGAMAAEKQTVLLAPELASGDTWVASVKVHVGGDLLVSARSEEEKLPLTVTAKLGYEERVLRWSPTGVCRSLRWYSAATADIQVGEGGRRQELPGESRLVIAEVQGNQTALNGVDQPLTRKQYDLLNVVGNTLALQRLLPGRRLAEGQRWDHSSVVIGPLLGLDYVAVCEVTSVVTGVTHDEVQIRLAGTVHGTIDGAPTEMELRAAYLFDLQEKRITKFNLAIKELRTAGEIVPGLDIVAKISVRIRPAGETTNITSDQARIAVNQSALVGRDLLFDASSKGYRFKHDKAWYVTGEQSEMLSLRYMHDGDLVAHCNVTTLPARSQGRATGLDQFEREVRASLGENLESVAASTRWATPSGYECLGVVATGKVADVPIEWRYYLIAADGLPRVSFAVTVEQSQLQRFNDSDRQLVDSLELLPVQNETAALKKTPSATR